MVRAYTRRERGEGARCARAVIYKETTQRADAGGFFFSFLFLLEISVLSTENAYLDFCPDSVLNFFPCLRARVCKREAR